MNKLIKGSLLFTALLLPVMIFIFLKMFGKNQFDIPVINHTSLEEGVTCQNVDMPHVVKDVAGVTPTRTANIYHISPEADPVQLRNLMKVKDRLEGTDVQLVSVISMDSLVDLDLLKRKYQVTGIWKFISASEEDIKDDITCEVMITNRESLVLVDNEGKIRGYYYSKDAEEVDRLILESKILLHDNDN